MNRQRAHHIARLLATTNEPVKRIAQNLGYLNVAHLSRFFHHEMNMSPRAYRMMQQSPMGAVPADPMSGGRETDSVR
jgi:AraC-like DNA-binding protein